VKEPVKDNSRYGEFGKTGEESFTRSTLFEDLSLNIGILLLVKLCGVYFHKMAQLVNWFAVSVNSIRHPSHSFQL